MSQRLHHHTDNIYIVMSLQEKKKKGQVINIFKNPKFIANPDIPSIFAEEWFQITTLPLCSIVVGIEHV